MKLPFLHHSRSNAWWLVAAAALAIGIGAAVGQFGIIAGAGVAGLLLALAIFLNPEAAFIASILTIILGQLIRLQLPSSDNTVIINDILLPAIILTWTLKKAASGRWFIPRSSLTLPLVLWMVVMAASLFANRGGYSVSEMLSGTLYAVRWIEYAAVLVIGYDVVRTPERAQRYLHLMIWTGIALAVLGFAQLKVFPDFSFMTPKGWDPHVGRLLSTWFDPNFLAGYLAFLTTIALAVALSMPWRKAGWWWAAILTMTAAIILTFSRSGYVGFVAGVGLVTLFRSRTILIIGLLSFAAVILFVPRVQERVIGIRSVDVTAQLRLVSWQNAWTVMSDHPVIGVGYNLYKYVQVQYDFMQRTSEHSASGSDSSILTVGVTTGFVGVAVYVWLCGAMFWEAVKTWRDRHLPRVWQGFGLGLAAGFIALFVHGQFVNGLLYPHIMQAMWLFLAMAIMIRQPQSS